MAEAETTKSRKLSTGSLVADCFILMVGVFLLTVGFLVAGSLFSTKEITGTKPGDIADLILLPVLLFFIPALLIAFATNRLRTHFRIHALGVLAITLVGFIAASVGTMMQTYNHFVKLEEDASQAFNNVEIVYQKRFNEIKNLDYAVHNYQEHERGVIKDIVETRKSVASVNPENKISALGKFDAAIHGLMVNIENYPHLKADLVVQTLMKEVASSEHELMEQKREFNKRTIAYNKSIRFMPFALVARIFHFQTKPYFDKEANSDIYDSQKLLTH